MKKIFLRVAALVVAASTVSPGVYASVTVSLPVVKKDALANLAPADVTVLSADNKYPSNSSANKGYKVSANKSYNEIKLGSEVVGYFRFDKDGNDPFSGGNLLIRIIKDDVAVTVERHCSKYYATGLLNGMGVYSLPQIMQDNGKKQSFDQLWIVVENIVKKPATYRVAFVAKDGDCNNPLLERNVAAGGEIPWMDLTFPWPDGSNPTGTNPEEAFAYWNINPETQEYDKRWYRRDGKDRVRFVAWDAEVPSVSEDICITPGWELKAPVCQEYTTEMYSSATVENGYVIPVFDSSLWMAKWGTEFADAEIIWTSEYAEPQL